MNESMKKVPAKMEYRKEAPRKERSTEGLLRDHWMVPS